jgi:transcriptional regulator GlxA family with amidase domain
MLALFSLLVEAITRQRLVGLRGDLHLVRLQRFIAENLHGPVTLAAAARAIGRSPSTVTHLVRARLGVSFKQAVIAAKLAAAERLLQTIPGTTVGAAAAAVGYTPFHFSRLYRQNRGRPPRTAKPPKSGAGGG